MMLSAVAACVTAPLESNTSSNDRLAEGKTRVLVSGLVVEAAGPESPEPDLPVPSLTALAARAGDRIVSSPNILATEGELAMIDVRQPGRSFRIHATAHVLEGDVVDVDVFLDLGDGGGQLAHTFRVKSGEVTGIEIPRGGRVQRLLLAIQPTIVHRSADLRRIYEERMRERDAFRAAHAAGTTSP